MPDTHVQTITDETRRQRQKSLDYAIASVRLEGFTLDDDSRALFARYVNGEIDRTALNEAVAKLAASYG